MDIQIKNNMISADTYAEVYEILSYMDKLTVMKIPVEILNNINDRRNKEYISRIDKNNIFNTENLSSQTIDVLAWLDVNYWIKEEKKNELKRKYEQKRIKQYSKNIFSENHKEKIKELANTNNNLLLIKEEKIGIFYKIKNLILKIFRTIKD